MKRLLTISLLVMALALTWRIAWPQAQPAGPRDLGDNAALKYWLAFAMMPTLTDAEDDLVIHWRGKVPDKAVADVLAKSDAALKLLHEATQYENCNWGLPKDGPDTPMPHLAKARQLSRLACLRARYRAVMGDGDGAVKDLLDAFTLSRQCNADGTLISLLVRNATQRIATNGAADVLKRLDQKQLKRLAEGLDSLPRAHSMREALLNESEDCVGWWVNRLKREGTQAAEEYLRANAQGEQAGKAHAKEPLTAEVVSRCVHQLEVVQRCEALEADMSELPPAAFEAQTQALVAKMKDDYKALFPQTHILELPLARIRYDEARSEVFMAMLKAGIAVVLDGPDRLTSFKDPFGDGPFEYSALGTGFQLKSKLVYEGKPAELTVPGL
jgi:hypothetical protein